MDDPALEAIARLQRPFSCERGPAEYRHDETGDFYEWEGKEIEAYHSTARYNWNVAAHDVPFIARLRATARR